MKFCWLHKMAHLRQQCHNHSSVTTITVSRPQQCHDHNSVTTTTVSRPQQCHDHSCVTTTAVSQPQQCHNHNSVTNQFLFIFQKKLLKVLKCSNLLWVQRRHNCSPAASFANCVMTLHLFKVNLQTFLSKPITQKCQILSCDTLVANERKVSY
jgi:hypothetical protein